MALSLPQLHLNRADHPIDVFHYSVVPKTDDFIPKRLKIAGSFVIIFFLMEMLTSIQLDDQFLFDGNEICDVIPDGVLTAEIHAVQFVPADVSPEFAFGGRGFFSQLACAMHDLGGGAFGWHGGLLAGWDVVDRMIQNLCPHLIPQTRQD